MRIVMEGVGVLLRIDIIGGYPWVKTRPHLPCVVSCKPGLPGWSTDWNLTSGLRDCCGTSWRIWRQRIQSGVAAAALQENCQKNEPMAAIGVLRSFRNGPWRCRMGRLCQTPPVWRSGSAVRVSKAATAVKTGSGACGPLRQGGTKSWRSAPRWRSGHLYSMRLPARPKARFR
jgi:hypothetical protein